MTLALVEEDLGGEIALDVARELVVFLERPGGQTQFSRALAAEQADRPALRELQAWIAGHLDDDLSVATLAIRANSPSAPSRERSAEVGQTPAAYVEALRIERARMPLEDGAQSLDAVARATGFRSAEVLRRVFHRRVGVSPPPTASGSGSPSEAAASHPHRRPVLDMDVHALPCGNHVLRGEMRTPARRRRRRRGAAR
jgi:transcriptional regulator GlxA family with amidase domain